MRLVYPFESQVAVISHDELEEGVWGSRDRGTGLSSLAQRFKTWLWPSTARCADFRQPAPVTPGPAPVVAVWF